jgi:hypothetical protein
MTITENGLKVADIVVKGLFGTLLTGGLTYYGSALENQRQKAQDDYRELQSSIELSSRQKELDVDLGMRLFGTLMSSYFQKDKSVPRPEAARQQMLLLRLVALNFEDVPIQLKPLFEDLDRRLTTAEDKEALRDIAQDVARRQAFRMTVNGGYDSGTREVKSGDSIFIPEQLMTVKIGGVSVDGIRATIYSKLLGSRSIGPFTIRYFDAPLVDNILLGDNRVGLLLLDSDADKAHLRIVAFPKHLANDRFDIKELSQWFRDTMHTAQP